MSLFAKLFGGNNGRPATEEVEADEALVIVPIPPLVDVLRHHETHKGAPLTQAEVEEIAGGAVCMMMGKSRAAKLAEARGYADIDPASAWAEWQQLRSQA